MRDSVASPKTAPGSAAAAPVSDALGAPRGANGSWTLSQLYDELSELRELLNELAVDVVSAPTNGRLVSEANRSPRLGLHSSGESTLADRAADALDRLRCDQCGRIGVHGAAGWTLRLCGDDALHLFCGQCDHQYFSSRSR